MFGTYRRPSRKRLYQRLVWAAESLGQEAERLEACSAQRDHVIATIITNLRAGATPEQVLEWWDGDGQQMLEGVYSPATSPQGEES